MICVAARRRLRRAGVVGLLSVGLSLPTAAGSAAAEAAAEYIVVLDAKASRAEGAETRRSVEARGGRVRHTYDAVLNGFAARLPAGVVKRLRADGHRVVPDVEVRTSDVQNVPDAGLYGLDRIDQRFLPGDDRFAYARTGAGVIAYVIDTGLRHTHTQFAGRFALGPDFVDGGEPQDCDGHGTHVAGTLGGTTYGVAKDVTIVPVRVLGCDGSGWLSDVIAGVNWVTEHRQGYTGPAVANMSLGAPRSSSTAPLDSAVTNSIAAGITYVVAAGNGDGEDACAHSPARVPTAITVGAADSTDRVASLSNVGSCVDLFAPGVNVLSAGTASNTATRTLSGTSMAAPHVAGAVAAYLQDAPAATPAEVGSAVLGAASTGVVRGLSAGSPDRLLYSALHIDIPGAPVTMPGGFTSLRPARVLDTRAGNGAPTGKVSPQGEVSLTVLGRGGVPASGVSAVLLNVAVTGPTGPGWITAHPAGTSRPTTANLNFATGQTASNLVLVGVGSGGRVDLHNGSAGSTHLIADVSGWVLGGTPDQPGAFASLTPERLFDTRSVDGPVAAQGTVGLPVLGRGGVPAEGVSAVLLNLAVTQPEAGGYLTAYPGGSTRPNTANLNFAAGQTTSNLVLARVGPDGRVNLFNGSPGTVQMVVDVQGYVRSGTPSAQGAFRALSPARVLDTRTGLGGRTGAVPANATLSVPVLGRGGVPATGVSAVLLNVAVTQPGRAGFVTAYPDGTILPLAANLNFATGQTTSNLVLARVGADGRVALYNGSAGTVHLVADVAGWF